MKQFSNLVTMSWSAGVTYKLAFGGHGMHEFLFDKESYSGIGIDNREFFL